MVVVFSGSRKVSPQHVSGEIEAFNKTTWRRFSHTRHGFSSKLTTEVLNSFVGKLFFVFFKRAIFSK